jgi:hypothetical protein
MKNFVENLDLNDGSVTYTVPIWRVAVSSFALVILLFLATILVCGTNAQCRERIPTLDNLIDSNFVAPFIVSAIYSVLSLHLIVSNGIYYLTNERAFIACKVQFVASILVYITVAITLFVFPVTDWDRNWANLGALVAIAGWMCSVVVCLRTHYKYKAHYKRYYVKFQIALIVFYCGFTIAYTVLRFFPQYESWLLVTEIAIGIATILFLGLSIMHVFSLKIKVVTE